MTLLTPLAKRFAVPAKKSINSLCDIDRAYQCGNISLISYFNRYRQYQLAAQQSLLYYDSCSPLYSGADWITSEVSIIEPKVWDKSKDKFLDTHPVLDLLNSPNYQDSYEDFMYALSTYFIITGNAYLMVGKSIFTSKASDLAVIPSNKVNIDVDSKGIAKIYHIDSYQDGYSYIFERVIENGDIKYLTSDKTQELFHMKNFNACGDRAYGATRLNSIYLEIEQYITAGIHNLTLLERGGNLSGIFTTDQILDDEVFNRAYESFQQQFSGAKNAGVFGLLDAGFKFNKFSATNKDMDFLALKKSVTNMIYNNLRIPLALVTPETMTMANMAAAKILLYDNAVLPLTDKLMSKLTQFLMPFYPNSENLIITYDKRSISALEQRRNDELQMHAQLGVLTINELRALIGYDPLDGGNELLVPQTEIPLATQLEAPAPSTTPASKETFLRILQTRLNDEGDRCFTDEEINQLADKYGLV